MFERFMSVFRLDGQPKRASMPRTCSSKGIEGFAALMDGCSGRSFDRGLYRLHDEPSGAAADRWVEQAFNYLDGKVHCFGYDWLGCQYAFDLDHRNDGEPLVMLIDPSTAEVYEIPKTFRAFHDEELVRHDKALLRPRLFAQWAQAHPESLPLQPRECVEFIIPPFLGGSQSLENLGLSDLEVYWEITSQLISATVGTPEGVSVSGATID